MSDESDDRPGNDKRILYMPYTSIFSGNYEGNGWHQTHVEPDDKEPESETDEEPEPTALESSRPKYISFNSSRPKSLTVKSSQPEPTDLEISNFEYFEIDSSEYALEYIEIDSSEYESFAFESSQPEPTDLELSAIESFAFESSQTESIAFGLPQPEPIAFELSQSSQKASSNFRSFDSFLSSRRSSSIQISGDNMSSASFTDKPLDHMPFSSTSRWRDIAHLGSVIYKDDFIEVKCRTYIHEHKKHKIAGVNFTYKDDIGYIHKLHSLRSALISLCCYLQDQAPSDLLVTSGPSGERVYHCKYCYHTCKRRPNRMHKHQMKHDPNRPKPGKRPNNMREHQMKHDPNLPKPFGCLACHMTVKDSNLAISTSTSISQLVIEKVVTHLSCIYVNHILADFHMKPISFYIGSMNVDISRTLATYLESEELDWALGTEDPLIKELLHARLQNFNDSSLREDICDMRNRLLPPEYAFSFSTEEYENCCVQRQLNNEVQLLKKWKPEPSNIYSRGILHTRQVPMYAEAYYDGVSPKFAKLLKETSQRINLFSILIATSSDNQGGYVAVCIIEPIAQDEYHCLLVDIWKQSIWDQYCYRISRAITVSGNRPVGKQSLMQGMNDRASNEPSDTPNKLATYLNSLEISSGYSNDSKLPIVCTVYNSHMHEELHVDKLSELHILELSSRIGSYILLEPGTEPSHANALFWTVYAWASQNTGNFAPFEDLVCLNFSREDVKMLFILCKGYDQWTRILVKIEPFGISYTRQFSSYALKWDLLSRTIGELKADVSEAIHDHHESLTKMSEHIPDYIKFISSAANGDVSLEGAENLPSDAFNLFTLLRNKYKHWQSNRKTIWRECMATIIKAASEDITVRSKFSGQGLCYLALEHTGSLSVPIHADTGSLSKLGYWFHKTVFDDHVDISYCTCIEVLQRRQQYIRPTIRRAKISKNVIHCEKLVYCQCLEEFTDMSISVAGNA